MDIRTGETETIAVLRPQPYRITGEVATALTLPCVIRIDGDSGRQRVVLNGTLTADVALRDSTLYATVDALPAENQPPNGRLVSQELDRHSRR